MKPFRVFQTFSKYHILYYLDKKRAKGEFINVYFWLFFKNQFPVIRNFKVMIAIKVNVKKTWIFVNFCFGTVRFINPLRCSVYVDFVHEKTVGNYETGRITLHSHSFDPHCFHHNSVYTCFRATTRRCLDLSGQWHGK